MTAPDETLKQFAQAREALAARLDAIDKEIAALRDERRAVREALEKKSTGDRTGISQKLHEIIKQAEKPLTIRQLRDLTGVRYSSDLSSPLTSLYARGKVARKKNADGRFI